MVEDGGSTVGEIGVFLIVDFGLPARHSDWVGLLCISPTSRLGDQWQFKSVDPFIKLVGDPARGEHTVVEKVPVNAVSEAQTILSIVSELFVEASSPVCEILVGLIIRGTAEGTFRVPYEDAPAVIACFSPRCLEVVIIPVGIAIIEIDEEVIDQVVDIDQLFYRGIFCCSGEPGFGLTEHGIPGGKISVDRFHSICP